MPRLAFKPDASFFEKIAIGAVGARAVVNDMAKRGHELQELENGSTATKMWKDVKRKRVRIPDLVCVNCGLRVESRAKSNKPELAVSHSEADAERAWDYGLVGSDLIAFPVCWRVREDRRSTGRLHGESSYWHSKDRVQWATADYINYFRVEEMRTVVHSGSSTKGVTEGSETAITWDAIFATRPGEVESITNARIRVRFDDSRVYTWQNRKGLEPCVTEAEHVAAHQVLAATIQPVPSSALACPGILPTGHIEGLLTSPERTQRFTGIKLARLRCDASFVDQIGKIGRHEDEDIYVRMEAAAYLVAVCNASADASFAPYLGSGEDQIRLEAVVALASAATAGAVELLARILHDANEPYFLRSAAAWALGVIGGEGAGAHLIKAFTDAEWNIREEALEAVQSLRPYPYDQLTEVLLGANEEQSAGAAESIRRSLLPNHQALPPGTISKLVGELKDGADRHWIVWLLAHLPRGVDYVDSSVADLQQMNPRAHFAVSVLWSFLKSWIAPSWELNPYPEALGVDE